MEIAGSTVLVTGGEGFVGSHLVEELLIKKAHVLVLARHTNQQSYFFKKQLHKRTTIIYGDILEYSRVVEVITRFDVAAIYHLAAQPLVEAAYYDPAGTIRTNIIGTMNILEAARQYPKLKAVILASSDKAYGKGKNEMEESDPLRGDHPYEVSKSAADLLAQTYIKTYMMPVVITRFGNIFGPGDENNDRIIPGIMNAIVNNSDLLLRSNGKYVRDYVYVKDVAKAYIFLLENLERTKGQIYNISSDATYSVMELITDIEKILGKRIRYKIQDTAKNEIPFQHINDNKIRKLGWKNRYSFQRSIKETFIWYKRFLLGT